MVAVSKDILDVMTMAAESEGAASLRSARIPGMQLLETPSITGARQCSPQTLRDPASIAGAAPLDDRDWESRRLLARFRAGDESAGYELLELNAELPMQVARRMEKKHGGDVDEFAGAGGLAMVSALDQLRACGHDNVRGYFTIVIKNAIYAELGKQKGGKNSIDTAIAQDEEPAVADDMSLDVWEELVASCTSDADRAILELRHQGYTLDEIASRVEMPRSTVGDRWKRIERRYQDRQE